MKMQRTPAAETPDAALLEVLLAQPARAPHSDAWTAPTRLVALKGRQARAVQPRAWRGARPLAATAASLLLVGAVGVASLGVAPARAAVPATAPLSALYAAPTRGALHELRLVAAAPVARATLLDQLLAAPVAPAAAVASAPSAARSEALLAELLASEPPPSAALARGAAAPAELSFATVNELPASALNYRATAVALPTISLNDNLAPPPPPDATRWVLAQQPPPPPGYVQPPGYRDGVWMGGQYPGLLPGQFPPPVARPSTPSRPTTPSRPVAASRPLAPSTPTSYIVRAGDTLSEIALRFYGNAGLAALIWEYNYRIIGANPNHILPGQRLTLPAVAGQASWRPVSTLLPQGAIARPGNYTIQPNDFLRWMAQRAYGNEMRWPEIYGANRNVLGPNPDLIYPGVRVFVP